MSRISKRMLAFLLATAMVLSLFTGITARAAGSGTELFMVGRDEGWDENGYPIAPSWMDLHEEETISVTQNETLFFGLVGSGFNVTALKADQLDKISMEKLVGEDWVAVEDEAGISSFVARDNVEPDNGFFNVKIDEVGQYRFYYDGDEKYVTINVVIPRVGIYSTPSVSIDSLISGGAEDVSLSFDEQNEFYLNIKTDDIELGTFEEIKIYGWDYGTKVELDPDDYISDVSDSSKKLTMPAGKDSDYSDYELETTVKIMQGGEWPEDHHFNFRVSKDGFCIAGVDWAEGSRIPSFARADWFNKQDEGEIPGETFISLGWSENSEVTPVADISNISIETSTGDPADPDKIFISNKTTVYDEGGPHEETLPDGVYSIEATDIGDYMICYNDGTDTYKVKYKSVFPRVGVYSEDTISGDSLVCRISGEVEFLPGETYYLIASDKCKADDNLNSIELEFNDPFVSLTEEWSYDTDSYEFTIPETADQNWYGNAIEFTFKYNDGREEPQNLNLKEKMEGWMITDAEWNGRKPTFRNDEYAYHRQITAEIGEERFVSIANLVKDSDGNYEVNPALHSSVQSIDLFDSTGMHKVTEDVGFIDSQYQEGETLVNTDDGVFRLVINVVGSYVVRMVYREDGSDKEYSFKVDSRLPQLALYSDEDQTEANIVASRSQTGEIDGTTPTDLYLYHNWDEGELNDINNIEIVTEEGMDIHGWTYSKDALKSDNELTKVTIPAINGTVQLLVKVYRGDPANPWLDEFHIVVRAKNEGFVITYDKDGQFDTNADDYHKDWGLETNVVAFVSLAMKNEDTVTPVTDLSQLSLKDMEGETIPSEEATIRKAQDPMGDPIDGVYEILFKYPGRFKLYYGETQSVDLYVDWPDIAFVSEEDTCYYPGVNVDKISDEPYNTSLPEGEQKVYEKEFYIGSYTEPDTVEGEDRREIKITDIIPYDGDDPIAKIIDGLEAEISEDGHTAKIYANMEAINEIAGNTVWFEVKYDIQYYYKDGGVWKEGRVEHDCDRWFEVYLGEDNRTGVNLIGEGWIGTTQEYDGTPKTVLYDMGIAPYCAEAEYEDNEKTEIGVYTVKATFKIMDEYKTEFKWASGENPVKTKTWSIVVPEAVTELENNIETKIPDNTDSVSTLCEDDIVNAREAYEALNDAQKALVKKADVQKLEKAEKSLATYKDAIEKINALPKDVKTSDEAVIEAARAAYDKLSEEQKSIAGTKTSDKLTKAEKALEKAKAEEEKKKKEEEEKKKEEADKKAADSASSKISSLPKEIKTTDEAAIKEARAAYDALTADQKKLVDPSLIEKLENAEKALAKAKEDSKKSDYSNEWVNGKWYNEDGTQTYPGTLQWKSNATGWWVEDTDGWYPTDKWQKIDGVWYYFKPDGYMAANEYFKGYWFNADGSWDDRYQLSWKSNATGWWVEDISGWWPSSCWLKIDGYWYYFDASGYMVTNQYVDGYWIGADGICY